MIRRDIHLSVIGESLNAMISKRNKSIREIRKGKKIREMGMPTIVN